MKVEVSKLSGAALDYTVAKCQGRTLVRYPIGHEPGHGWWIWEETSSGRGGIELSESIYLPIGPRTKPKTRASGERYTPSTDWSQGGDIIEREDVSVMRVYKDWPHPWCADRNDQNFTNAETPLVAAMRAYVGCRLGDVVEIPDELM